MAEPETVEKNIDQSDVVEKYKAAGIILDQAFDLARKAAYDGMNVRTLCQLGDTIITKNTASVFQRARTEAGDKLDKGVAFPTCVCINNCASHFCPIETDPEASTTLSTGDVVTIQMGAHIDGYSALASQTVVVKESKDNDPPALTGRAADVVLAAYTAAEAVLRLMRPGNSNVQISDVITKVANEFEVEPLEGVLSHQMKRYVIDGSKVILNRQTLESKAEPWDFEDNEVYNLDVVMSTGEGKAIQRNTRATVYKRQVDVDYQLKMKTSRQVFSEINKSHPTMPFTLRALTDPRKSRMAMTEMLKHSLVTAYPVLYEKDDAIVARCSMTVLVTPNNTSVLTKSHMPTVQSDKEIKDEEIIALLAISMDKKKKKKKKKAAAAATANGTDTGAMET